MTNLAELQSKTMSQMLSAWHVSILWHVLTASQARPLSLWQLFWLLLSIQCHSDTSSLLLTPVSFSCVPLTQFLALCPLSTSV